MSKVYKIIFLYFKKDLTMVEIAIVLGIPVELVQRIIGEEVAQHYLLGEYDRYISLNSSIRRFNNQHVQRERFKKPKFTFDKTA